MFCANCGTKQNEGEKFCPNCGTRFEEPKNMKKEVSNDASKQSKHQKGKATLPNEEVAKNTETVVDNTKVSDVPNKKETKEKDVSKPKEKNIKTENKGKKKNKLVTKSQIETVIDNSQLKQPIDKNISVSKRNGAKDISMQKEQQKDVVTENAQVKDRENKSRIKDNSSENIVENILINSPKAEADIMQRDSVKDIKDKHCLTKISLQDRKESILKDYDRLFEKIEEKLFLINIEKIKQTGIVSDRISISSKVFYESKKKYHDALSLVYNDALSMYKFKVYITDDAKKVNDIKRKINKYNNLVVEYGYNSIQLNEKLLFVEGQFIKTKRGSNVGFFKSLLISEDEVNREKMFEHLFKEIYNLCESIKV